MKKLSVLLCVLAALCLSLTCVAETTDITYESRGVEVPATVVTPDDAETYPVVVLCHGHGGNRAELAPVQAALAEAGVASIAMDFPGCGDSTESFQLNILSNMETDAKAAIDYAKDTMGATKIGLFGYSMGGRIVLELLADGTASDACAFLAPAADTEDLKNLFGGAEAYETMRAEAETNGYVVFTTIYGQVQELSKDWFADLDRVADSASAAAAAWQGPALVVYGSDDEAVNPTVSANVAEVLGAETFDCTGEGHGYGLYSEDDTVRNQMTGKVAEFFAENLK